MRVFQDTGNGFPAAGLTDTSTQKLFFSPQQPFIPAGAVLQQGDRYYCASVPVVDPSLAIPGMTLVLDEQFASIDPTRWSVYNNSTFGAPNRIQTYYAANAVTGQASPGATGGTSLKLFSYENDLGSGTIYTRYAYTAGMLDSKSAGIFYPRYGVFEWRVRLPHGQGLWPSFWLTARIGGASEAEYDLIEYFHAAAPGKNSTTIHGTANDTTLHTNKYTNNGSAANNLWGRTFFEAPTYAPGWHVWRFEIVPVTDAAGTTLADPTQPSTYVRLTGWLDGVKTGSFVDTTALHYTTNGGSADSFWNVYLQGCEIDGPNVGHPRDILGYSHETNSCLISGTPPNSCAITASGYTVQRAQFGDPSSTVEIDHFRNWKYTG